MLNSRWSHLRRVHVRQSVQGSSQGDAAHEEDEEDDVGERRREIHHLETWA